MKVIWPWAKRKPHRKTSISEIIKVCLKMVVLLQPGTVWIYPRLLFKMKEHSCLTQKISKPKVLSFTAAWARCGAGSFWKRFHCCSPRNVHISIKQPHPTKRPTLRRTPVLYSAACTTPYACTAQKCSTWLSFPHANDLSSQQTLPVEKKPIRSTRD